MLFLKYLPFPAVFTVFLHRSGVYGSAKWSYFQSGVPTTQGRLNVFSIYSVSHCATECYSDKACTMFGYDSARKMCFLHDESLTDIDAHSSSTLKFYKRTFPTCETDDTYKYITSIDKCIWYVRYQATWDEAFDVCINSGGHLVHVRTNETLNYISMQRETFGTKFWIGGTQVTNGTDDYQWTSGEIINSTNGGQFWTPGSPSVNDRTSRLCILAMYVDSSNDFGFLEAECNKTKKFFCEKDMLLI